jgi:hypothetical protein
MCRRVTRPTNPDGGFVHRVGVLSGVPRQAVPAGIGAGLGEPVQAAGHVVDAALFLDDLHDPGRLVVNGGVTLS